MKPYSFLTKKHQDLKQNHVRYNVWNELSYDIFGKNVFKAPTCTLTQLTPSKQIHVYVCAFYICDLIKQVAQLFR